MVVIPTQEDTVVDIGLSPVLPGNDVMDFAPVRCDRAAGDDTAAVSGGDGTALIRGEEAFLHAEVENLSVLTEDHLLVSTSTDHLFHGAQRDWRLDPVDPADPCAALEVGPVHMHHHRGGGTSHAWCLRVTGR